MRVADNLTNRFLVETLTWRRENAVDVGSGADLDSALYPEDVVRTVTERSADGRDRGEDGAAPGL